MVYMCHITLVQSIVDGHLGWFRVFAIVNSAAMNIPQPLLLLWALAEGSVLQLKSAPLLPFRGIRLKDHNSSTTWEHNMTEKECHEMTETGFRRWIITNFSELKEHILTQCKETKNLEKRLDEMLSRITSLEKNINDLMELKNTAQEVCEANTRFNS
ncbi:LINE-1 retrotransposable element ORF1 protein [Plecturocebus cupreus]